MENMKYFIGKTSVIKLPELDLNEFEVSELLPDLDKKKLEKNSNWLDSRIYDPKSGSVFMSVHTWVLQHNGKIMLIDTGAGNFKSRPNLKVLDNLKNPYIERLKAIGIVPEDVDYILLTHIHADHVGWNTTWKEDEWVPTFPNAKVICSEVEYRYGEALESGDETAISLLRKEAGLGKPERTPILGVFEDSMRPIKNAGLLQWIPIDGHEVLEGVRFLPSPGHSICHASISISSGNSEGIFGGDIVHHPFELYDTNLTSVFCEYSETARESRIKIVERVVKNNAIFFSSHFPESSAGYIYRENKNYSWKFLE